MSLSQAPAPRVVGPSDDTYRSTRAVDRAMRRVLRVEGVDPISGRDAHRAFQISVAVSAVRCLITCVVIPLAVATVTTAGWVAAPVGLALCAVAAVNGVVSVRRFWAADHRHRWTYTAFIGVVFVILTLALVSDLARLGVIR